MSKKHKKSLIIITILLLLKKKALLKKKRLAQIVRNEQVTEQREHRMNVFKLFSQKCAFFKTNNVACKEQLGVSTEVFNQLTDLLSRSFPDAPNGKYSPEVQIGVFLEFSRSSVSIRKLETYIGVPKTAISVIIERVCSMLCTHVGIETPKTAEDWQHVEDGFLNKGKIRCLGSIDGKHIEIKAPPNSGSLFFNYKGYFSFVLLALVDSEGRFLWIDVGCPGSTNDASIFNNCSLKRILENGENLPMPSPLGTSHHPMPSFIVGDGIFPLSKYLMKPFSHKTQDVEEQVYNQELSRTRNIVENAFGRLSNRFRCFHGPLELSVSVAKQFVMSTCIIHNIMTPKADAPKISRHPSNFSTFRDHKEQREELKRFINL